MTISLSPELQKYVDEKLASGKYASPDEVVSQALIVMRNVENASPSAQDDLRRELHAALRDVEEGRVSEWDPEEIKREIRQNAERTKKAV